jgi:hypothetical protein
MGRCDVGPWERCRFIKYPSLNYRVQKIVSEACSARSSDMLQNRFMRLSELHLDTTLEELRIAFEVESIKASIAIGHL